MLRFNRGAYLEAVSAGTADPNEGVEDAFEVVAELSEKYVCLIPIVPRDLTLL